MNWKSLTFRFGMLVLLAILPMFDLRVFQRSSDIFQEMGLMRFLAGEAFPKDIREMAEHAGQRRAGKV